MPAYPARYNKSCQWQIIYFLLFITVIGVLPVKASTLVKINRIWIEGNKKTRNYIVLRELQFSEGDTLSREILTERITQSRLNLLNTSLFNFVSIDTLGLPISDGQQIVDIEIHLLERWYAWPVPVLQITDRNLNSWLSAGDFTRINAGLDMKWNNITGRMDVLKVVAVAGKNQQFGISYSNPYINRTKTTGVGLLFGYMNNREVGSSTNFDKMVFSFDREGLYREYNGEAFCTFRKGFFNSHRAAIGISKLIISDTLFRVNPEFFYPGVTKQSYIYLNYKVKFDHRDIQYYPLTGWYADLEFNKKGIGLSFENPVNTVFLKTTLRYFQKYSDRWFSGVSFMGKISGRKQQPYLLTKGLGFNREMVRGYELNVIDGEHFAVGHSTIKFAVLPQRNLEVRFLPGPKFSRSFLAVYLTAFADAGYVWSASNNLLELNFMPNSFLFGTGLGLDMVTYYDKVMRIEYSVNRTGHSGIFVSFISGI